METWIPIITAIIGFLVAWTINIFRAAANHYQAVNQIYLKERIELAKAISKIFEKINHEVRNSPIMNEPSPWPPFNDEREKFVKYERELFNLVDQYSFFFNEDERHKLFTLVDLNTFGPPNDVRDRTDWFWAEDISEGTGNRKIKKRNSKNLLEITVHELYLERSMVYV